VEEEKETNPPTFKPDVVQIQTGHLLMGTANLHIPLPKKKREKTTQRGKGNTPSPGARAACALQHQTQRRQKNASEPRKKKKKGIKGKNHRPAKGFGQLGIFSGQPN